MKKVQEIKSKREVRYYKQRMKASKKIQAQNDRKELKEGIDLIGLPRAEKERMVEKLSAKEKVKGGAQMQAEPAAAGGGGEATEMDE